jgi:hypothetical protein
MQWVTGFSGAEVQYRFAGRQQHLHQLVRSMALGTRDFRAIPPTRHQDVSLGDYLMNMRPMDSLTIPGIIDQFADISRPVAEEITNDEFVSIVSLRKATPFAYGGIVPAGISRRRIHSEVGKYLASREWIATFTIQAVPVKPAGANYGAHEGSPDNSRRRIGM